MKALHIVPQNPIKKDENPSFFESKLEQAQIALNSYLAEVKITKDKTGFETHEAVIVRRVNALGQAALLDTLSQYDVNSDVITVADQSYRFKHRSTTTYQTAFGAVAIKRHVYANRKKDGDGKSIVPMELQAGIIEGYWTPIAAKNAAWALAHLTPQESGRYVTTVWSNEPFT